MRDQRVTIIAALLFSVGIHTTATSAAAPTPTPHPRPTPPPPIFQPTLTGKEVQDTCAKGLPADLGGACELVKSAKTYLQDPARFQKEWSAVVKNLPSLAAARGRTITAKEIKNALQTHALFTTLTDQQVEAMVRNL